MSDEQSDYQKIQEEVIDKLILAGWVEASARRGDTTTFLMRPEARECVRKLRDFMGAFDAPGVTHAHAWMFFKIIGDDTFSDHDRPHRT